MCCVLSVYVLCTCVCLCIMYLLCMCVCVCLCSMCVVCGLWRALFSFVCMNTYCVCTVFCGMWCVRESSGCACVCIVLFFD